MLSREEILAIWLGPFCGHARLQPILADASRARAPGFCANFASQIRDKFAWFRIEVFQYVGQVDIHFVAADGFDVEREPVSAD